MRANEAIETEAAETLSVEVEDSAEVADDSATGGAADEPPAEPTASANTVAGAGRGRGTGIVRVLRHLRPAHPRLAAAVLVIILTGTATIWSYSRAQAVHANPAVRNTALTDVATTAALKTQITQSIEALFSFDFSSPSKTDAAVPASLTGPALSQYATLMAPIRTHAAALKLVLTTSVTSVGVQTLQGARARVLVFADQTDTSTATTATTESAVAFAVDTLRVSGNWRIAGIDTLGA